MAQKFLFIVDPLSRLNVATDTTLAIMQEACIRGKECFAAEIGDIFLHQGKVHFLAAPVFLAAGYKSPPTYLAEKSAYSGDDFAAVFMRKDPPVDELFWSALLMLRCFDPQQTLMVNNPDGILVANEKLFGQQVAHEFYPATLVSGKRHVIEEFMAEQGKVVLKPLFGAGGSGVLVLEHGDLNTVSALEILSNGFQAPIMVQAYIKNARAGDKRILLLGGEALGAVLRVPHASDHRANFHAGGNAMAASLSTREKEIVRHLRPFLLDLGLYFVGIDVIDGYLTEINVTSPTCLLEMEALGQAGLRAKVLDYIDVLLQKL